MFEYRGSGPAAPKKKTLVFRTWLRRSLIESWPANVTVPPMIRLSPRHTISPMIPGTTPAGTVLVVVTDEVEVTVAEELVAGELVVEAVVVVGAGLGSSVGSAVGNVVGVGLGSIVGSAVGNVVGTGVGPAVVAGTVGDGDGSAAVVGAGLGST